jgi:hypothetical protein
MAEQERINAHFLSLVYSISAAALQQLGKIANPMNSRVEKNLDQARISIDILEMLNEKTQGNLTLDETRLLTSTLTNLQLNFVDELENDQKPGSMAA